MASTDRMMCMKVGLSLISEAGPDQNSARSYQQIRLDLIHKLARSPPPNLGYISSPTRIDLIPKLG
jgi:hypothetical protein